MLHYHVSVVSRNISIPTVIVENELEAIVEYFRILRAYHDMTGEIIKEYIDRKTTFSDGGVIRIRECDGTCFVKTQ